MWLCLGDYHGPKNIRAFIMYALARLEQRTVEKAFRTYIADSFYFQGQSPPKVLGIRFDDWLAPQPEETRTADEIISKIKSGLGGQT